jgi:hypothetical protein
MIDFCARIVALLGCSYDDPDLQALLARCPPHKLGKPSDGSQYAVSKPGGFDLLFEDADPERGHRQARVLRGAFLFNAGADGHHGFAGDLPFAFTFADSRAALIAKRTPARTWVIGRGRVAMDHPAPDSDIWQEAGFNLHASYGDGRITHFYLCSPAPLREEDEWKPEPTWQDLALLPDQKKRAIDLYRKETGATSAEALRAVNDFLAGQGGG